MIKSEMPTILNIMSLQEKHPTHLLGLSNVEEHKEDSDIMKISKSLKDLLLSLDTILALKESFEEVNEDNNIHNYKKALREASLKINNENLNETDLQHVKSFMESTKEINQNLSNILLDEESNEEISTFLAFWDHYGQRVKDLVVSFRDADIENVAAVETWGSIQKEIEDLENQELTEEDVEGMFKVTGEQFKKILNNSVVKSISGYVLGVTDRSLKVRKYQPISLNEMAKIRPPVSVINNDTILYIEKIEFFNKKLNLELNESDLAKIIAFI